jgi:hypothetical protein
MVNRKAADDFMLIHQARKFEECEFHLEKGLEILSVLSRFFHLIPLKTGVTVFHLGTDDSNRKLSAHPTYLEMTLERTLSYTPNLEKN